jgi:CRP/FNR family transcriptional regulator
LEVNGTEINMVRPMVNRQQSVKRGDFIFRQGDKFRSIIAVTQGAVKLLVKYDNNQEQVLGFRLIGEVVGLGGMHRGHYLMDAQALENSLLCEIPFERFEKFAHLVPQIQRELRRLLSDELVRNQYQSVSLGKKTAEARLASFLWNISDRYHQQGCYSIDNYILPMARHDIANFLGLTKETISRLFQKFQEKGILLTQRKRVRITNIEMLKAMAGVVF